MVRNTLLFCFVVSTGALMAQMPRELQLRVAELHAQGHLAEIRQVSYKDGTSCAALIGLSPQGRKVAFVSLRYAGNHGFAWTPFAFVPFDQRNDSFGLHSDGHNVVVIQSDSSIDHANTSGFHVELDSRTQTVILRPVEAGSFNRMPDAELEFDLVF